MFTITLRQWQGNSARRIRVVNVELDVGKQPANYRRQLAAEANGNEYNGLFFNEKYSCKCDASTVCYLEVISRALLRMSEL